MKRVAVNDEAISGVNIIPVIDVTLVLLVILLVMSPVLDIPTLNVQLPEAMTKETKDENLTVSISADGKLSVDNTIVDAAQLPRALRQSLKGRKNAVVIVRADKSLPYGTVEGLIRTVNRFIGDHGISIATQQRAIPLNTNGAAPAATTGAQGK